MTFLPIVSRELLAASRRRGTYWVRLASAAAGLIIGGWVMLVMHRAPPAELGIALFVALSVVAYVYCLFIGVFRTADCLSEEKREGTLGLLFLTDLKGYDVVFGKLAATSLNAFYGVLALLPVMALPLLIGGVTLVEFWRVTMAAINLLFFSLSVGMFCSSISRDERRAMVGALIILIGLTIGLWLLAIVIEEMPFTRGLGEYFLIPSPACAAGYAFEAAYSTAATKVNPYYSSLIFTHVLSWLLLLAASLIVPRTWQDKALTAEKARRRERLNRVALGSTEARRRFRHRLLDLNPFYWLVARHRTKPFVVWAFLALVAAVWTGGFIFNRRDWTDDTAYISVVIVLHTVLKFWLATEASRRFSLDRQSGALELLLSTPLPVKEIVRGQWMGLERQFAGPVFAVLLADFVFLLAGRRETGTVIFWIIWMIILLADIVTLAWLGMWRGLNSRRPNRAAAAALVRVLVLPWMLFLLTLTLPGTWNPLRRWSGDEVFWLWLAISLGVDVFFGVPARRRLLSDFRAVVAQRFQTRGDKHG